MTDFNAIAEGLAALGLESAAPLTDEERRQAKHDRELRDDQRRAAFRRLSLKERADAIAQVAFRNEYPGDIRLEDNDIPE